MINIAPRPWKIAETEEEEDDKIVKYEHLVDANGNVLEPYIYNADKHTLEFIAKAVNEHDNLVAEIEQLKEALRKCEVISNNVLYFDDDSDYVTALWQVLNVTQGRKVTDDCYDVKLEYIDGE